MLDGFKRPQGPRRSSDNPKPQTRTYSSEAVKPWQVEDKPKPVIKRMPVSKVRSGKRPDSIKIRYKDELIFRGGWFVLLEERGGVCVLTREDAKVI